MLSRTAENLYWLSRYVERAENIARLLDVTLRMASLPQERKSYESEWRSTVIAIGLRGRFFCCPRTGDGSSGCALSDLRPEQSVIGHFVP